MLSDWVHFLIMYPILHAFDRWHLALLVKFSIFLTHSCLRSDLNFTDPIELYVQSVWTASLQIISLWVCIILPLLPIIEVWVQARLLIFKETFPRSIYSRRYVTWISNYSAFSEFWLKLCVFSGWLVVNWLEHCSCRLSVWLYFWLDYVEVSTD